MYSVDIGQLQQQAGTYYNSVTDRMETLPTGAPSYGDGSKPQVRSMWESLGGVGEVVSETYDSAKSSVKSVFTSVSESVAELADAGINAWVKWVLFIVGVFLVVVWVVGKSGVIGQAAPLAGALL